MNLYKLELSILPYVSTTLTMNNACSFKHLRLNEESSILLHKCLCHISKQRTERLINDEILWDLDVLDFDPCVDCIKGKFTDKIRNVKADRCTKLLGVIHTNICGSFTPPAMGGHKYFITFIDDYSFYGFVKLIRKKSDALEAFKAKVELQQGQKIKVVHSEKRW